MKIKLYRLLIMSLLFVCCAESLRAQIVTSGERKTILEPATVTEPGEYFLGRDISGPIVISANNVIIDLNNNAINGGTTGLEADGVENITIKNGVIKNTSSAGISANNSQNVTLQDLLIDQAGTAGASSVLMITCTCILFDKVKVQNASSNGVTLSDVHQCIINDTIVSDCGSNGLRILSGSEQVFIMNSSFLSNGIIGLSLISTQSSVIQSCIVEQNITRGIDVQSCFNIRLKNNQTNNNVNDGIRFLNSQNCCLLNHVANNNGGVGINQSTGNFNNSFFSNKAQINVGGNFSGSVPIVAVFDLSVNDYTTPPTSGYDNISVVP